eukprot:1149472-Pelagomonas_calceolata.AAC.1
MQGLVGLEAANAGSKGCARQCTMDGSTGITSICARQCTMDGSTDIACTCTKCCGSTILPVFVLHVFTVCVLSQICARQCTMDGSTGSVEGTGVAISDGATGDLEGCTMYM